MNLNNKKRREYMSDQFEKDLETAMKIEATSPSGAKIRPSLKAVPEDPTRTTKQMIEQFTKVKQGLQEELIQAHKDQAMANERVDDLMQAIHIMSAAITMLTTD
jgi:hypothetical protein